MIREAIKKARKAKGMTQQELAEEINITSRHMSDIERGVKGVSLRTLEKIFHILEIKTSQ